MFIATAALIAHWPLTHDARDFAGALHGAASDVQFVDGAAQFDGDARIEIPHADALRLDGAFTLSLWVNAPTMGGEALGGLVGKFDPATRQGFNLGLMTHGGVTSSQSNWRNLHFGIDDGQHDTAWRDCGRPGKCIMVWALAVHDGHLYAGTFETGAGESGHVYRYGGGQDWIDCGSPQPCNTVTALTVFDGSLYAATGHYRSSGSSIAESENTAFGGRVFRYLGERSWEDCGDIDGLEAVFGLAVFDGALHASSMYSPGVYRFEGPGAWRKCAQPEGRMAPMYPLESRLYAGGYDAHAGGAHAFDGETWSNLGGPPNTHQTYSFALYRGKLHAGTWPDGKVYRYESGAWFDAGRLGEEKEVMAMSVYNGALYAGTLPAAAVYRLEADGSWRNTGELDPTPDVKYRRAWSMATYQGKLFCGTLPAGRVYAFEAGKNVTHDAALASGWRHIAAVREHESLALYVDGICVGETALDAPIDTANAAPLRLGCGEEGGFRGSIRDVRIYGRALSADELALLCGPVNE